MMCRYRVHHAEGYVERLEIRRLLLAQVWKLAPIRAATTVAPAV